MYEADKNLPPAYGGCTCPCHLTKGYKHIAACCNPIDEERRTWLVIKN